MSVIASVAIWAAVTLKLVGDEGTPEVIKFRARYRRLKTSERKAFVQKLMDKELTDADVLKLLLVDWDLKDKQGNAIAYTEATLAEMVEAWDGMEQALVTAWFDNNSANGKASEKNSEAPSSTPLVPTALTETS